MKIRDSGMPEEAVWRSFFDPGTVLERLGLTAACRDVVEFGCGYGTFTIPAARIVPGTVVALDIEAPMLELTGARAARAGLANVRLVHRDFIAEGTGLPDGAADYGMLFNILHPTEPVPLLREAFRTIAPGGRLGVMHWNHDPMTPRGPDMAFRPRPGQCLGWAEQAGFEAIGSGPIELPPYHWGMSLNRPA